MTNDEMHIIDKITAFLFFRVEQVAITFLSQSLRPMRTYIYTIKIIGINKSTTKSNSRYQMSELSSSVRILQYMFLSVVRDPLFVSSPFVSDVEVVIANWMYIRVL
jgi:hypothetical protein